jgi:hypothetical protein
MTNYRNFRERLDVVLRTLDVQQVREFLVAEGQWEEDAPADANFAMYMMIASSQTLKDLHPQAHAWLMSHGHSSEAQAVYGSGPSTSRKGSQGSRSAKAGNEARKSPRNKNRRSDTHR